MICAAHKTKYLTDKFGLRLPIMPVKGWVIGVTVPQNFRNSLLTDFTYFTPSYFSTFIKGKLRLSGCAEIGYDG